MDDSVNRTGVIILLLIIFVLLLAALGAMALGDSCFLGDACERGVRATQALGREMLRIQLTEMAR